MEVPRGPWQEVGTAHTETDFWTHKETHSHSGVTGWIGRPIFLLATGGKNHVSA